MSNTFNALTAAHFHHSDPGTTWDKDGEFNLKVQFL
jgi:hypothetical protein